MQDQFQSPSDGGAPNPYASNENQSFESPDQAASGYAESEASGVQAYLEAVPSELMQAKQAVEQMLTRQASEQGVQAMSLDTPQSNIVGVGISYEGSDVPGEPCLNLFVVEDVDQNAIRSVLASSLGVSAASNSNFPVYITKTGVVDAYSHRMRMRPAPGGISVGHFAITAGTLGCLARGRSAPRSSRLMILSNNHVLANSNAGAINSCIAQPGPADGGRCPQDQVAVLERFVPIRFGGAPNFVDCATAWAWPDRVRREMLRLNGTTPVFFRVGSAPVPAVLGMQVGKTGRTTQLTNGRITAVGVTINVNFGAAGVARFEDQIAITGNSGLFSQGGDSGSLIWRWDATRAPVGLLFAGGGGTTFANRIGRVLDALDINLFT
jgi:hypothetical protein